MLRLTGITKDYIVGEETVHALRGVDVSFRDKEFVAILGASGCGKTTLLNIIGGLDRYTSGDLVIAGKSTKDFTDRDWDNYRNHKIGFVFQSYNLIPHQTVLENVEIALTLAGVSKAERRKRSIEVLDRVGLKDKINVRPSQLSGGQMQRVAIARALVNDPDIILADEPTGALDTVTSVQIMDILREISQDKLIIMVTHNPELADTYANRIIRLSDGEIVEDTAPYVQDSETETDIVVSKKADSKKGRNSMSFFTALGLSFRNLLTKIARTFMVSFAGSIGIIGIALILALSSGFQGYINTVQRDTLSSYPITIEADTVDMTAMMSAMMDRNKEVTGGDDAVYSNDIILKLVSEMSRGAYTNDLHSFRTYLDAQDLTNRVSSIEYEYAVDLNVYLPSGELINPSDVMQKIIGMDMSSMEGNPMYDMMTKSAQMWSQALDNDTLLREQYALVDGKWATEKHQLMLIVGEDNLISDYAMYSLGLKSKAELDQMLEDIKAGKEVTVTQSRIEYSDVRNMRYGLVPTSSYYVKNDTTGLYEDKREDEEHIASLMNTSLELEIVGIIKVAEGVSATSISGSIVYLPSLTDYLISTLNNSSIVIDQRNNPTVDVLTGKEFSTGEKTVDEIKAYVETLSTQQQTQINIYKDLALAQGMSEDNFYKSLYKTLVSNATYDGNMSTFGEVDLDKPSAINIYPVDFDSRDYIELLVKDYNAMVEAEDYTGEGSAIKYSDIVGTMMSSVSTIIDAISYVLIAFVSISLVVSSIMIGVITYISVLERTKEIGVLRAMGASKADVSRVFNAETFIIGLSAGLLGVLVTGLLTIPINLIINSLAGIPNVAYLPPLGAVILVGISVLLTCVAGLIPARIASQKDPVVALRTE
ncbi:MAG: ABC transporter ATP-binding protein/permease [Clostridia bacterium]|nr:ABC transporter ATP-binding protein/permease [Clostridia bacterium]